MAGQHPIARIFKMWKGCLMKSIHLLKCAVALLASTGCVFWGASGTGRMIPDIGGQRAMTAIPKARTIRNIRATWITGKTNKRQRWLCPCPKPPSGQVGFHPMATPDVQPYGWTIARLNQNKYNQQPKGILC